MSWRYKFLGRYKNIALKMSLSLGNKSDDSFNLYLQKSIARWEPSFSEVFFLNSSLTAISHVSFVDHSAIA